jgi:hypothetical protein
MIFPLEELETDVIGQCDLSLESIRDVRSTQDVRAFDIQSLLCELLFDTRAD